MSLDLLKAPPDNTSRQTHRILCISAQEEDPIEFEKFQKGIDGAIPVDQIREDSRAIMEAYNKRRKRDAMGHMAISGSFEFVKGVLHVGATLSTATGPGGKLILEGVNYGLGKLMDTTLKLYDESAKDASGKSLMNSLKVMREQGDDLSWLQNVDLDNEDAAKEAMKRIQAARSPNIPTMDISKVDANGRPYLNHHMIEQLKKTVKEQNDLKQFVDTYQAAQIQELQAGVEEVGRMGDSLMKIQNETDKSLIELQKTTTEIKGDVEKLSAQVGENAEGIAFIKEFMYGKMTPEEQLEALETGKMKLPNQEAEIQAKKLLVKRKQFVETANKYLNGANVVAGVLGQVGILKPKLAADISKAANAGMAIVNGASALASGNFIGAISAVGSLMGIFGKKKKGPDIAELRHNQIMQRFTALEEGQEEIKRNQKKLMKGQQKIFEAQVKTFNALIDLGEQIHKRFDTVMAKLEDIHEDILINRTLIVDILNEDLEGGIRFLEDRENAEGFDAEAGEFKNYEGMARYFNERVNNMNFEKGIDGIEKTHPHNDKVDPRLHLKTYNQAPETEITRYKEVYEKMMKVASLRKNFGQLIAALLSPTVDIDHFNKREIALLLDETKDSIAQMMSVLSDLDTDETTQDDTTEDKIEINEDLLKLMAKNLDEPLSVDAISSAYNLLIGLQVYYQLQNPNKPTELYAFSDLEGKKLTRIGQDRLKEALEVVDLAIAQQSLLAGEPLLEVIKKQIEATDSHSSRVKGDPPEYKKVTDALKANSLLRHNMGMYLAHCAVYGGGKNRIFTYQLASQMSGQHPEFWRDIFKISANKKAYRVKYSPSEKHENPWVLLVPDFNRVEGGRRRWGYIELRLPSAEKLQHGLIEYAPEMHDLLKLRDRMVDAILDYELRDELSDRQKAMYFKLNVLNT